LRVVAEMEKRIVGSHAIKRRVKVVFPAPEGEDKISNKPRLLTD
jgi:hypothetical protein